MARLPHPLLPSRRTSPLPPLYLTRPHSAHLRLHMSRLAATVTDPHKDICRRETTLPHGDIHPLRSLRVARTPQACLEEIHLSMHNGICRLSRQTRVTPRSPRRRRVQAMGKVTTIPSGRGREVR